MSITIDMGPEIEDRLEAAAKERGQSISEYVYGLVRNSLPLDVGRATQSSQDDRKFEEARKCIRNAMVSLPEFAKRVGMPLEDTSPADDPVLEAACSRKHSDELFDERFGKDLGDQFRTKLSG